MIRYGLGILVAATGAMGALALQACSDDGDAQPTPQGNGGGGGATGTGGGGGQAGGSTSQCQTTAKNYGGPGAVTPGCSGACCPASASCYSSSAGATAPGAECLATQDNTGKTHIQMRQQWIRAVTPAGNAAGLVYAVLAGRTQLPWKMCNQTGGIGSGGYIQLVDFFLGAPGSDISTHYSTVGYAKYIPGPATPNDTTFTPAVLQEGFCYGKETYVGKPAANGKDYSLAANEVGDGAGYPPGLPKPMALKGTPGWTVGSTKAKRIAADFDACTDRLDLLAKLDPDTGEYGKAGFGGVFYYDDATGVAHGFGRLGWVTVYDGTGATHISIPIREVETHSKFNNKDAPNCVGAYRADALDPATCVAGQEPTNPGWGGGDCSATTGKVACAPGESAASTKGYFLISELEQIYANDLQMSLCASYPGNDPATSKPRVDAEGFFNPDQPGCKTAKWNPSDPVNGLPKGDWCAKTNGPATADCHDAWRSISFHAFAGAKIQLNPADDSPVICDFGPQ